jgi:hypothetical protein
VGKNAHGEAVTGSESGTKSEVGRKAGASGQVARVAYPKLPTAMVKAILEIVKHGDIDALKIEIEQQRGNIVAQLRAMGEYEEFAARNASLISIIADDQHKQNAIYFATLIKDDGQACRMTDFLVKEGVKPACLDHLN